MANIEQTVPTGFMIDVGTDVGVETQIIRRETWKPGKEKLVVVESIEFIWGKNKRFQSVREFEWDISVEISNPISRVFFHKI